MSNEFFEAQGYAPVQQQQTTENVPPLAASPFPVAPPPGAPAQKVPAPPPAEPEWDPFEEAAAPVNAPPPEPFPVPPGIGGGALVREKSSGRVGIVLKGGKLPNDDLGRERLAVVVGWLDAVSHPILAGEFEVL